MPLLNGLDAVEQLRRLGCQAKVVFRTMHKDALYAAHAMSTGASGLVLKHSASADLLTAIQQAMAGQTYITPSLRVLLERLPDQLLDGTVSLTRRQREVLQLFAEGHTAKEVAKLLYISTRTAEGHKAQIRVLVGNMRTAVRMFGTKSVIRSTEKWEKGRKGGRDAGACPVVRICWRPMAAVLDFEFWISNLFGISILGFRIFRFGCWRSPR